MKIIVHADIHGNYDALLAVLEDAASENADKIFSLGDNIGYGPEPEKVVRELIKNKVHSVMGNHEYALINPGYFNRLNFTARESLDINLKQMSAKDKQYSEDLPLFLGDSDALFVHGCPPKSSVAYLYDPSPRMIGKVFGSFNQRVAFFGHTHAFDLFEHNGNGSVREEIVLGEYNLHHEKRYLINPGSVGQPRDVINNMAKYLVWDLDRKIVTFKAVPYDIQLVVAKIKALGLPDSNWKRLM